MTNSNNTAAQNHWIHFLHDFYFYHYRNINHVGVYDLNNNEGKMRSLAACFRFEAIGDKGVDKIQLQRQLYIYIFVIYLWWE